MRIFILILGLLIYARLNSQLNFGEFNTPYSGVHGLSFNPAEVADSRYKFHANIIGVGLSASNNFIGVSSELKSSPIITPANQDQYFIRNLNGKPKNLYLQSDMMMPSAFMSFGRNNKLVFGFQTGIKALVTANNISERLANFLYDKNDTLRGWGPSSSKDFAANVSAWSYMGLTIGGVILDSRKITLKGAITGKLNQGIANMYMSSPDLYVSMSDGNVVRDANFTMKHQYASPLIDNNKFANSQLSIPGKHSGFGLDAGLIFEKKDKNDYSYEFDCRSDNYRKDKNKYAWRFGVSIIDYGSITWKPEGKTIRSYTIDSAAYAFPLNYKTFNKAAEPSSYIDSLRKYRFNGIDVDTTIEEYIAIRPEIKSHLIDKFNIPENMIEVIYNPVDNEKFQPKDIPSENYVLFVGTIDYLRKETILDLIEYTRELGKELWLVGENNGNYLENLLLESHVKHFPSTWNVEDFILKSDETAGIQLGRTTIEGWMCGKPSWIYKVDSNGFILSKEKFEPPLDIEKYHTLNVAKQIKEEYIKNL